MADDSTVSGSPTRRRVLPFVVVGLFIVGAVALIAYVVVSSFLRSWEAPNPSTNRYINEALAETVSAVTVDGGPALNEALGVPGEPDGMSTCSRDMFGRVEACPIVDGSVSWRSPVRDDAGADAMALCEGALAAMKFAPIDEGRLELNPARRASCVDSFKEQWSTGRVLTHPYVVARAPDVNEEDVMWYALARTVPSYGTPREFSDSVTLVASRTRPEGIDSGEYEQITRLRLPFVDRVTSYPDISTGLVPAYENEYADSRVLVTKNPADLQAAFNAAATVALPDGRQFWRGDRVPEGLDSEFGECMKFDPRGEYFDPPMGSTPYQSWTSEVVDGVVLTCYPPEVPTFAVAQQRSFDRYGYVKDRSGVEWVNPDRVEPGSGFVGAFWSVEDPARMKGECLRLKDDRLSAWRVAVVNGEVLTCVRASDPAASLQVTSKEVQEEGEFSGLAGLAESQQVEFARVGVLTSLDGAETVWAPSAFPTGMTSVSAGNVLAEAQEDGSCIRYTKSDEVFSTWLQTTVNGFDVLCTPEIVATEFVPVEAPVGDREEILAAAEETARDADTAAAARLRNVGWLAGPGYLLWDPSRVTLTPVRGATDFFDKVSSALVDGTCVKYERDGGYSTWLTTTTRVDGRKHVCPVPSVVTE